MPTEEGLALWAEHEAGLIDRVTLRTYAARLLAVDHARDHGILSVVRYLADFGVALTSAIEIALRVKRGLRDPNSVGGSTKDWGYLGGLSLISKIASRRPADIDLLRTVKWSADYLDLVRDLLDA